MRIWPAIDLRGGKCVRLRQGDYQRETIFSDDPVATARYWVAEGAECLHLVDLDGARSGKLANLPSIEAILQAVDVPCQLGGGIRDESTIEGLLKIGLERLVIGTRAIKEPEWLRRAARIFPRRLVLGIDSHASLVATDGWLETSPRRAVDVAVEFTAEPLAAIVYTDIAVDGMLTGPNLSAMKEMRQAVPIELVASGGVTTADDVSRLAAVPVDGCIIGRALYEGKLRLADALAAAGHTIPR